MMKVVVFVSERKANYLSTANHHHIRERKNTSMLAFSETANLTSISYYPDVFFAPKYSENNFFIKNNPHIWEQKVIYSPQTTSISEECSMYPPPQKYHHVNISKTANLTSMSYSPGFITIQVFRQ